MAEAKITSEFNNSSKDIAASAYTVKTIYDLITSLSSNGCNITSGQYTGTGTYGKDNPNLLTFSFIPKLLFVFSSEQTSTTQSVMGIIAPPLFSLFFGMSSVSLSAGYYTTALSGKTVTWYCTGPVWTSSPSSPYINGSTAQCNANGKIYNYIAIG